MKKILLFLSLSITIFAADITTTDVTTLMQANNNLNNLKKSDNIDNTDESQQQMEKLNTLQKENDKILNKEELNKEELNKEELNKEELNKEELNKEDKESNIFKRYYNEYIRNREELKMYGMDIINNSRAVKTTKTIGKDYILGMGDTININSWSDILLPDEANKNFMPILTIDNSGNLFIPNIGIIKAEGKTIAELEKDILYKANKKIKNFNIDISLKNSRTFAITVIGEINKPGIYSIDKYYNLFNILYTAGGINKNSSIRNIKIKSKEKETIVDLYDYINGNKNIEDIKINDGDIIYVPVIKEKVALYGELKKKCIYELKNEKTYEEIFKNIGAFDIFANKNLIKTKYIENLQVKVSNERLENSIKQNLISIEIGSIDKESKNSVYIYGNVVNPGEYNVDKIKDYRSLIETVGGYKKDTYLNSITLIRLKENYEKEIITFNPIDENIELKKNDTIYVYNRNDIAAKKYSNIIGAVKNPGNYEIYKNQRVLDLINFAGGIDIKENVFYKRADIYRVDEQGELNLIKFDLEKALAGDTKENIILKANDIVKIYKYEEVIKPDTVYIYGNVKEPGKIKYYKGMTLEDTIFYAKGLEKKADRNIVIARNEKIKDKISEIIVDYMKNPDFKILPNDVIFVRKDSTWQDVKTVKITGFVKYPGEYLLNDDEGINSIINRAGGFKSDAFPNGIQIKRKETQLKESRSLNLEIDDKISLEQNVFNLKVTNLKYDRELNRYKNDIKLIDGDEIYIPNRPTTVKVVGEVYAPSIIAYNENFKLKDYIDAAGGYKEKAYEKKVFIIKANGKAMKENIKKINIEAGDTIIVPKDTREKSKLDRFLDILQVSVQLLTTVLLVNTVVN
ncbi:protein involved in polysaccharide export with SLBB domain [Hypnocyclicus thermotrophus]|uniref:Protein involved in polysaccharide export with SLBB domain n=1 Tax=Hypnocyclicus thermotrophus TaxID=1627895 RepID=A0AA46I4W5_9FUSO|nr:SLBB domain-containing protein [Hypnocyclicus thermotrophus]TDT67864.1 protein involved in polysaccharide export with SLBB domain [Hypnocyclicus thermotrophus]